VTTHRTPPARIYEAVRAADGSAVEIANMLTVGGVVSVRAFPADENVNPLDRCLLSPAKARELARLLILAADRVEYEASVSIAEAQMTTRIANDLASRIEAAARVEGITAV
jgi:hypothetical protein